MSQPKIIVKENYSSFYQGLSKLRSSGMFCDLILNIKDQQFPTHRCVLASSSKFFESLLTGNFIENRAKTIILKEFDTDVFTVLLEFIYTGILSISRENVVEVLKMADFLQLQWAKNECSKYIFECLTPENCVELWQLAKYFCVEHEYKANECILSNLERVLTTDDWKELDVGKLEEIFQHDRKLLIPAEVTFMAIMEWLKYDLPNRKADFNVLSKYISKYLKTDSVFEEFLKFDISKVTLLSEEYLVSNWMRNELNFSAIPQDNLNNGNIFISALYFDLNCYKIEPKMNKCISLTKPNVDYNFPVNYKNNIYFTGGRITEGYAKVCPKYNIETQTWSEIPFDVDRWCHGSCVLNDEMYIVAGKSQQLFSKEIQMYDFNRGQLISLKSKINHERIDFGIATQDGAIYICGGESEKYLNSVERFDPREGKFVLLPDMGDLHGECTSAFVSHGLYCSTTKHDIVKKFDIRMNSWENIPNLPSNQINSLVESGRQLYSCEGETIFHFNMKSNQWRLSYPIMPMFPWYVRVIATSF